MCNYQGTILSTVTGELCYVKSLLEEAEEASLLPLRSSGPSASCRQAFESDDGTDEGQSKSLQVASFCNSSFISCPKMAFRRSAAAAASSLRSTLIAADRSISFGGVRAAARSLSGTSWCITTTTTTNRQSNGVNNAIGSSKRSIQTNPPSSNAEGSKSSPGLFSISGLNQPSDFLSLASTAISNCNHLRAQLSSALESESTASSASAAVDTLHTLDDISNEVCSVIDAAELCRSAHSSAQWREAADNAFALLSDYIAELNGDDTLYRVLVTVTAGPYFAEMSEEEQRVAMLLQYEFERDGIHLPAEERAKVREVIGHITQLEGMFNQNITTGSRKLFDVDSHRVEAVIPRNVLVDHVPQSEESSTFGSNKITVSTDNHIANSLLKYSADPVLRKEIYMEVNTACSHNLDVLDGLVAQRHKLATMLGFSSYAERFLQDKMAKNSENVSKFLTQMGKGCERQYKADMELLSLAKSQVEGAGSGPIEAWDVPFYTGALKAKNSSGQGGDANEVGGYFTVDNCLDGMKILVRDLFGIQMAEQDLTAQERWDGPDCQPIRKFQLSHEEEGPLGVLYLDWHPRESKYAHAAHFTVKCGCQLRNPNDYQLPIVALVCNLSPAYANVGSTCLLSHSEVETLFHEFGHALHSLLSRTVFQHLSGTRAAMDFIETPSHLFESYVWDPTFLNFIGKHYSTGEHISEGAVSSLISSRNAFRALEVQTQIVYSRFDQEIFGPQAGHTSTTDIFARLHKDHAVPYAPGTHWHSRFGHLVTYGSGYYGYLYSQVFAADIWQKCFSANPLSSTEGKMLWKELLRHGGARDPNVMLSTVLGREPSVDSFFQSIS